MRLNLVHALKQLYPSKNVCKLEIKSLKLGDFLLERKAYLKIFKIIFERFSNMLVVYSWTFPFA